MPVTIALMQAGLLNVSDLDAQLAKGVDQNKSVTITFTMQLMKRCVFVDKSDEAERKVHACLTLNDLFASIEALYRLCLVGEAPEEYSLLLSMRSKTQSTHRKTSGSINS